MAIEFSCPECSKLLSVPDGSEGRQARCPSCSAVCDVPAAASASADSVPTPGESEPPAPRSTSAFVDNPQTSETDTNRDGPAWERDGKSVGSFVETVKEMFTGPSVFGRHLRRSGGHWAPLGFGMIGSFIGFLMEMAWQQVFGHDPVWDQPEAVFIFPFLFVCMPLLIAIIFYLEAGLVYLLLLMIGGAKQGFEATFRVVAYTTGATSLLAIFPAWNDFVSVAMVVYTVVSIIVLAETQEISRGKAAMAVLIPLVFCFGMLFVTGELASFEFPEPG